MRILKFAVVAAMLILPASLASASIEATSRTTITNFLLDTITGTVTPVGAPSDSYLLRASMDTIGDTGFVGGIVLDGPIQSIGTAVADNSFPVHGTVATDYAFADSDGSGNIIAGNATVTTMSSLGTGAPPLAGLASATDQLQVQNIRTNGATVQYSFDADLSLDLSNMPSTPSFVALANAGYSITINGTVDTGGFFFYTSSQDTDEDFSSLNRQITLPSGPASYTVLDSFLSQEIVLPAGTYQFQISQSNRATLSAVPEPASILVWGLLGFAAMSRRSSRTRSA